MTNDSITSYLSSATSASRENILRVQTFCLSAQFFLCLGEFNPLIIGISGSIFQRVLQLVAISLTLVITIYARGGGRKFRVSNGVWAFSLIMALYLCIGVAISDYPSAVAAKSATLILTTISAILMAESLGLRGIFTALKFAATVSVLLSTVFALAAPAMGQMHRYLQEGAWRGIYGQKNVLGYTASYLAVVSFAAFTNEYERKATDTAHQGAPARFRYVDGFLTILGLIVCFMSQSRGALGLAIAAMMLTAVLNTKYYRPVIILTVIAVFIATVVAGGLGIVHYNQSTDHIAVGPVSILVNRGPLWSWALELFRAHPLLGYGLGGSWSPERTSVFESRYGWVLDNFHSGFVLVVVELGLAGAALVFGSVLGTFLRSLTIGKQMNHDLSAEMNYVIVYLFLFLGSNLTETYLLRSTDSRQFVFTAAVAVFWSLARIEQSERFKRARLDLKVKHSRK